MKTLLNEMTYIPTVVTLFDHFQLTLPKVSKVDHNKLLIGTSGFGELFSLIVDCDLIVGLHVLDYELQVLH